MSGRRKRTVGWSPPVRFEGTSSDLGFARRIAPPRTALSNQTDCWDSCPLPAGSATRGPGVPLHQGAAAAPCLSEVAAAWERWGDDSGVNASRRHGSTPSTSSPPTG